MASLAQVVHTAVNALVSESVEFDVTPQGSAVPIYNMFPVSDPQIRTTMCEDLGGESLFQFDGYDTNRYTLYETMDSMMKVVRDVRGDLSNGYSVWDVDATGVRAQGTLTDGLYHYIFEATFKWSLTL